MRARGADFSSYQDDAALTRALQHGLDFAFVKATEGVGYVNPIALKQVDRLTFNGVRVGLYAFLRHDVDGASQWDFFERTASRWLTSCVVACDQETDRGVLVPDSLARAFIRRGRQRGFKVGRYGDGRVMTRALGEDWRWYARWAGTPPAGAWDVWQFAAGEQGDPDWNVFKGDRAQLAAWWAKQGAVKRAGRPRWWLHDELEQRALGPYRLPRLGAALVAYAARHRRSGRYQVTRK